LIKMPYIPVYAGKCKFRAYELFRRIEIVEGDPFSIRIHNL